MSEYKEIFYLGRGRGDDGVFVRGQLYDLPDATVIVWPPFFKFYEPYIEGVIWYIKKEEDNAV